MSNAGTENLFKTDHVKCVLGVIWFSVVYFTQSQT